tara:strand:- start:459 stop:1325 length:867 start_codon:yes stop_codon:yes gene_type:complete
MKIAYTLFILALLSCVAVADDRPFTVGENNIFLDRIPPPTVNVGSVDEYMKKLKLYSSKFPDLDIPEFQLNYEDESIREEKIKWMPGQGMHMNRMLGAFCRVHELEWDFTFRKEGNTLNIRRQKFKEKEVDEGYTHPDRYSEVYRNAVLDTLFSTQTISWKNKDQWLRLEIPWKEETREQYVYVTKGYSDYLFVIPLNIFSERHHEGYIWAMYGIHSSDFEDLGRVAIHGRGEGWYWYNHINTVSKEHDPLDFLGKTDDETEPKPVGTMTIIKQRTEGQNQTGDDNSE